MPPDSLTTFMNFPYRPDVASIDGGIAVYGVEFDLGTTGRPGTRFGPGAIRSASRFLVWEPERWPWRRALPQTGTIVDNGNVEFAAPDTADMSRNLAERAQALLQRGAFALAFGGDHYVTLPILRGCNAAGVRPALIHFDAHTDTYDESPDNHGVMFRVAHEDNLLDAEHSIQIGIRTWWDRRDHPYEVLDADWVMDHGVAETVRRIHARVGERPAYVTFDIDCLDPGVAPGTGTPVAGGLSTQTALRIVRGLAGLNLVGADVVEVSPAYDRGDITALAAATLALDMIYVAADARR